MLMSRRSGGAVRVKSLLFDYEGVIGPELGTLPFRGSIARRRDRYVCEVAGVGPDRSIEYRDGLLEKYRTDNTCTALMLEHGITAREYNSKVYGSIFKSIGRYVHADPGLASLLGRIRLPMAILSNVTEEYVRAGLGAQGLAGVFRPVLGLESMFPLTKPGAEVYKAALALSGFSPASTAFVDDTAANLEAPGRMGMVTVHISPGSGPAGTADYTFGDVKELLSVLVRD